MVLKGLMFLAACLSVIGVTCQSSKVSTDIAKLQQLVDLGVAPTSGKWEIFSTPEYNGGVPGPTDYITLVAELRPFDSKIFKAQQLAGLVSIAPESARPWLGKVFWNLLNDKKNTEADFSKNIHCRNLTAKLRRTGTKINGLACEDSGAILIYLKLFDGSLGQVFSIQHSAN